MCEEEQKSVNIPNSDDKVVVVNFPHHLPPNLWFLPLSSCTLGVLWGWRSLKTINRFFDHRFGDITYQIRRADSLANRISAFKYLVLGTTVVPLLVLCGTGGILLCVGTTFKLVQPSNFFNPDFNSLESINQIKLRHRNTEQFIRTFQFNLQRVVRCVIRTNAMWWKSGETHHSTQKLRT